MVTLVNTPLVIKLFDWPLVIAIGWRHWPVGHYTFTVIAAALLQ